MNANELADEFRDGKTFWQPDQLLDWGYEAATMLRQQQAEIEALKDKLNKYYLKEDLDKSLNLIYGKAFIK